MLTALMDALHIHGRYRGVCSASRLRVGSWRTQVEEHEHHSPTLCQHASESSHIRTRPFRSPHISLTFPLTLVNAPRPLEPLLTSLCASTPGAKKSEDDSNSSSPFVAVESVDPEAGPSASPVPKATAVTCRSTPVDHEYYITQPQQHVIPKTKLTNTQYTFVTSKIYHHTSLLSPNPERRPQKKIKRRHTRRSHHPSLLEKTLIRVHADSVRKRYSLDIDSTIGTDSEHIIIVDEDDTLFDGFDNDADDEFDDDEDADEFDDDEDDEIIDDLKEVQLTSTSGEHSIRLVIHDSHEESERERFEMCNETGIREANSSAGADDSLYVASATAENPSSPISKTLRSQIPLDYGPERSTLRSDR